MKQSTGNQDESPSQLIDAKIKNLDDWRGVTLAHVRALIKQADAKVVEEWKGGSGTFRSGPRAASSAMARPTRAR